MKYLYSNAELELRENTRRYLFIGWYFISVGGLFGWMVGGIVKILGGVEIFWEIKLI